MQRYSTCIVDIIVESNIGYRINYTVMLCTTIYGQPTIKHLLAHSRASNTVSWSTVENVLKPDHNGIALSDKGITFTLGLRIGNKLSNGENTSTFYGGWRIKRCRCIQVIMVYIHICTFSYTKLNLDEQRRIKELHFSFISRHTYLRR